MTTIRDVARQLNISIATVSRAMDGYYDVAESTRQLVIQTAHEMGYAPNRAARQLRRQKAETIGFIIPAISDRFDESYFMEFIAGMGDGLSGKNFDLLVANATTVEMENDLYERWVNSRKVDGFILNRVNLHDWRVQYLAKANVPFVSLGKSDDGIDYPCIRIDGSDVYVELVRHLLEQGFSRFAFIGGLSELIIHIERLQWFQSALTGHGLKYEPQNILSANMTIAGGYEAANILLSHSTPPDALLCVNDETAFGALEAARDRGLKIGKDIAIVGFDGVKDSEHTVPPLTTLDIPVPDIARQLVRMILAMLQKETLPQNEIIIRPSLVIRASTGGK
jgi:LacI family transcriptional regulator